MNIKEWRTVRLEIGTVQACNFRYRASLLPSPPRDTRLIPTRLRIRMKIQRFIIFPLTVCLTFADPLFTLFACRAKVNVLFNFFYVIWLSFVFNYPCLASVILA